MLNPEISFLDELVFGVEISMEAYMPMPVSLLILEVEIPASPYRPAIVNTAWMIAASLIGSSHLMA